MHHSRRRCQRCRAGPAQPSSRSRRSARRHPRQRHEHRQRLARMPAAGAARRRRRQRRLHQRQRAPLRLRGGAQQRLVRHAFGAQRCRELGRRRRAARQILRQPIHHALQHVALLQAGRGARSGAGRGIEAARNGGVGLRRMRLTTCRLANQAKARAGAIPPTPRGHTRPTATSTGRVALLAARRKCTATACLHAGGATAWRRSAHEGAAERPFWLRLRQLPFKEGGLLQAAGGGLATHA